TDDFIAAFRALPPPIQDQARKNYRLWQSDPYHPSLHFKRVHVTEPLYSVRIGRGWRALGLLENDSMTWFWIGSHADYERLLDNWSA
ncbi:MAG: hypothetical protein NZ482_10375, partial [Gloeomargarita sp. SKYG98]|nr:hypothetical protein [Gloeomargarita sp. SKYG98]